MRCWVFAKIAHESKGVLRLDELFKKSNNPKPIFFKKANQYFNFAGSINTNIWQGAKPH